MSSYEGHDTDDFQGVAKVHFGSARQRCRQKIPLNSKEIVNSRGGGGGLRGDTKSCGEILRVVGDVGLVVWLVRAVVLFALGAL